jgi:hypothetical protein
MRGFRLFGLICVILGAGGAIAAGLAFQNPDTAGFQTAPGRIVKSVLRKTPSGDAGDPSWRILVQYTYQVNGQNFDGNTVPQLNDAFPNEQDALNEQSRWYEGLSVDVFYDPANPRESTLQIQRVRPAWIGLLASLTLLGLGVIVLIK